MVKKEGSTGPPQPDFTTVNGKTQQDKANLFYGDKIKSKIDYERKLNVVGAIQDKSADLTAIGMSLVDKQNKANIIAENYMKAFGKSDAASAQTALSNLGMLNTNNSQYDVINGRLVSQTGNQGADVNIKDKSVYEIAKTTMYNNGVPNDIQDYVLARIKTQGGQNQFFKQNQNMKGFSVQGTRTAAPVIVTPGLPGSAP